MVVSPEMEILIGDGLWVTPDDHPQDWGKKEQFV